MHKFTEQIYYYYLQLSQRQKIYLLQSLDTKQKQETIKCNVIILCTHYPGCNL